MTRCGAVPPLLARQFEVFTQLASRTNRAPRPINWKGSGSAIFSCSGARRRIERLNQFVKSLFEVVELADLAAGIGREVVDCLAFLADAQANVGIILEANNSLG
jgi:hypothetical protein